MKIIITKLQNASKLLRGKRLHDLIAETAVRHFKKSFEDEGFTDRSFKRWDEVKRRQSRNVSGARASRKILTGDTGNLGDSIDYKFAGNDIIIKSNLEYSEAHNKGTSTAGRNRNTKIPKRQFIGDSKALDDEIEKLIKRELDKALK